MQDQPEATVSCRAEAAEGVHDPEAHLAAICAAVEDAAALAGVRGGTQIVLVAETLRTDFFRGHLRWQTAAGHRTGPTVEFGILDAGLGPAQYRPLARGLVDASDLPQGPVAEN